MIALLNKINVGTVLAGHFRTLVDESSGSRSWGDYGIFYGFPVVLGLFMYLLGMGLSNAALIITTTSLSILSGLLFNLLVLLHRLSWPGASHPLRKTARSFVGQVYANISYSIVASLTALVLLIVTANLEVENEVRFITSAMAASLVVHFVLTMVMILKRMYVILQDDFSSKNE